MPPNLKKYLVGETFLFAGSAEVSETESDGPVKEAKTKITILFWNSYWIWSHYGK